ncbi:MAG: efflux transporter, RND family, MFP subunit, nonfunctional [Candidatus Pacebacteria bacterium GW2011_GWA1_46_10]|nr:MAG: efflux transporter, RND family, MFP subunit, nonfunctional [Candidatus Pacebacteria bacterium GW2011_GWA1_46_10]
MEGDQPMYACPMHPEETSDQPGNCPQCGMAMVVKEEKSEDE